MATWKNLDKLNAYARLQAVKPVDLASVMSGENGADRVKKYSVPMAAGLTYNYAAKAVNDEILDVLAELADEAELTEKYAELYTEL